MKTTYIIFTKAPVNLYKTYYQNSRRGEKSHEVQGKEEMMKKVEELENAGETVLSVRTALGSWVKF